MPANTPENKPTEIPATATPATPHEDPSKDLALPAIDADAGPASEEDYDRIEAARFAQMLAENGGQETKAPETTAGETTPPTAAKDGEQPPPAPAEPAPAAPAPARNDGETAPPEPETDSEKIERLRRALRERDGKYGSEKQQYETQLAETKKALEAAQAALREREAADAAAAQEALAARDEPAVTDDDIRAAFKAEDIEQNGIEYYRELMKAADIMAKKRTERLHAQLAVERRGERVFDAIERRVPGYRKLNAEAQTNGFGKYLNEIVPETGLSRRDHAQDAIRRYTLSEDEDTRSRALDALANIVGGFANRGNGGTEPSPQPQPAKKPAAAAIDPKDYVTPAVTAGQAPRPPAPKKYSAQQIAAYLAKAASQGEAAYDRAAAWVAEQQRLGLAP